PIGASSLTLGATAVDLGSNVGTAAALQVNVIPDPKTTASGRVVDPFSTPVAGAAVDCMGQTATSAADGTFSIPNIATLPAFIFCSASFTNGSGLTLHGTSARVPPVRGGTSSMGDVVLLAVPIITAITPKTIDSFRAPTTIVVTGINLTGATFAFAGQSPIVTAGTAQIDPNGTSATIPINVTLGAAGTVVLVGTNSIGSPDAFDNGRNTIVVLNLAPTADADGDGLTNEFEIAIGTDPNNA